MVAVSEDTLDFLMRIRVIRHDLVNELPETLHSVLDQWIVLSMVWAGMEAEGLFDSAFEHSPFLERDR